LLRLNFYIFISIYKLFVYLYIEKLILLLVKNQLLTQNMLNLLSNFPPLDVFKNLFRNTYVLDFRQARDFEPANDVTNYMHHS
jgi:hypothetical protein